MPSLVRSINHPNFWLSAEKIILNIITATITRAVITTDMLPYLKRRLSKIFSFFKLLNFLGNEKSFLPEVLLIYAFRGRLRVLSPTAFFVNAYGKEYKYKGDR